MPSAEERAFCVSTQFRRASRDCNRRGSNLVTGGFAWERLNTHRRSNVEVFFGKPAEVHARRWREDHVQQLAAGVNPDAAKRSVVSRLFDHAGDLLRFRLVISAPLT